MDDLLGNLLQAFEELGITVDEAVLEKCVELCKKYNVTDAEEFVDTWMAYSLSKLHGDNPTVSYLGKFERDEYAKKMKSAQSSHNDSIRSSLVIYEANNLDVDMPNVSDIKKAYNDNSSMVKNVLITPENKKHSRDKLNLRAVFSPASFSPTITSLSSKYVSRTNSGEIVSSYKNEKLSSSIGKSRDSPLNIERLNTVDINRYMNYDLVDALDYADDAIEKLGNILQKKFGLEDMVEVRYKHPSSFVTIGRIACDSDGRLNSKSVILEGSKDLSLGESIQLDLSAVEKYSLFPGQVVAVEGVNITGGTLMAQKIYSDASPESSVDGQRVLGPLSMILAAGPFTQSDSMTYQPLIDLMDKVVSDAPDILVLTGPFIDCNHPTIIENSLAETYSDLFKKIVDLIMRPLQSKKTQVLMVSSFKDCVADYVYPTPHLPLKDRLYPNLNLLPDPSLLDIGGVIVGVTSTDILIHIGKEEVSSPGYSTDNRLSRIAGHILSQRHFYPLSPAFGVPIDPTFMESAKINIKPDILILPSDFRYFIKDVNGCTVVNPERLAKGLIGGTYARLQITSSGMMGDVIRI